MISVVVGRPGSGKTYFLAKQACKYLKQGKDCYTNFVIDIPKATQRGFLGKNPGKWTYWQEFREIINVENAEIFIDEAQIWMDSREWSKLPKQFRYKLAQHRHDGLNMWVATQSTKRVDTIIRELSNTVYAFKKVGPFFVRNEFDIEDIDKAKRKSYSTRVSLFSLKFAQCYDTLAKMPYEKFPSKT